MQYPKSNLEILRNARNTMEYKRSSENPRIRLREQSEKSKNQKQWLSHRNQKTEAFDSSRLEPHILSHAKDKLFWANLEIGIVLFFCVVGGGSVGACFTRIQNKNGKDK